MVIMYTKSKVSNGLVYTNVDTFNWSLDFKYLRTETYKGSYILVALEISNILQNVHLYYYQTYRQRDDFIGLVDSYDIPNTQGDNMVIYTMPSPNKILNAKHKKIVENRFNGKPRPPQAWTLGSRIYRIRVNLPRF